MKKIFFSFLMGCSVIFCMEPTNEHNRADEVALPSPRNVPNSITNLLIDCIKPGEVLFSVTTEAVLGAEHEFNDFMVVCFQSDRYKDAFYFVPEKMAKDAQKALSLYSKTKPRFYAYLVPVKDNDKFKELANKSSAGCANKSGDWVKSVNWELKLDKLDREGFTMLDRGKIEHAIAAPNQGGEGTDGSWSCGPNTGYRTLRLLGEDGGSYYNFVKNCPRFTKEKLKGAVNDTAGSVANMLWLPGIMLAPFTCGLSLTPSLMLPQIAQVVGESITCDVGPRPTQLADYLAASMQTNKAYYSGYIHQLGDDGYEKSIARDIYIGYPRIILLISGTTNMHYVNIIGFKRNPSGLLTEAVILDTNGCIGVISASELEKWLNRDGYADMILPARYNTIETYKK